MEDIVDDNQYNNESITEPKQMKRWEYLYEIDKKKKEAQQIIKQMIDEEKQNDPNCTFKPNLSKKTEEYVNRTPNMLSVIDRQEIWNQQKQMKLNEKRVKNQDKDLENCTFQPQLFNKNLPQTYKNSINMSIMPKQYQSESELRGINSFIKRQEQGRQIRVQKKEWEELRISPQNSKNVFNATQSSQNFYKCDEPAPIFSQENDNISANQIEQPNLANLNYQEAVAYLHNQLHCLDLD